ncbi:YhgE/Pip domain-containing protein [Microlunatus antarcticus]|uniref:Putative membrane protein n=1 Tax=Microlunatus antarcticus TaxID=53388 RepID=A0A7W5P9J9_9ACTN|nr:YhgE/Pip domain-containing protein [Microlunatus antarcticus]MBB3329016.1 putative membrane protein [Microlunatus antarcticus]
MITLERADGSRRVGLWSLVGLLLVPLVLAGGFLATTWKSTDRLDRVQAAIVNLDEPVKIDKQTVPLGRQLSGGLVDGGTDAKDKSDTNFSWVLTDASDASDGLGSGRYAAVVTIPKDFSANATSYSDQSGDTAEQAVIDVQTSAVSGVSDPVVGQAITAAATRALNSELTEQYVKSIYVGFNDTQKQFTKVADAAGQLDDGTRKLADGLGQTSTGTKQLSDGLNQLDDGGAPLASGAKKYADGVGQFADGIGTLADSTSALPKGGRQLADGAQDAADGLDQLADGGAGIADGLKQYQAGLRASAAEAEKVPKPAGGTIPCPQTQPALTEPQCAVVVATLEAVAEKAGEEAGTYAGAQGAAKALRGAADGVGATKDQKSLLGGAAALADGQKQAAKGVQQLADGTDKLADGLTPLAAGIKKLDTGAEQLASGADDLSSGIGQYTGGVSGVATGAEQLSTGLVQLSSGADKLADGTKQLADGLDKGAKQIPTYDKTARERLSTVVATPVASGEVTSVFSNVATTTLLAVLALWVGGLASFLVLRAVSAKALASMRSSWRLTLESLLPAAVVAAVQAVILTVLLTSLLDLGAASTARVLGLTVLAGLVFAALNQALVGWFGGVGRFVSVVLVVLTAAGAITSAVPVVFDSITPLLPLTPALEGLRAVAAGAGTGGGAAALLVAWLVVGLAAAVLATARHRVVRAPTLVPAAVR